MSHSNISNFTNFLDNKMPKETQDEVLNHAKAKAKIAKDFIPSLTKKKQGQLEAHLCTLSSITAIDNYFRVYLDANM